MSAGARHATIIRVTLAEGASLLLRDELLLGRHGEAGGAARSVLHVNYAGRPLLRQSLEVSGADPVTWGRRCWPATGRSGRRSGWIRPPGKHTTRARLQWLTAPQARSRLRRAGRYRRMRRLRPTRR